MSDKRTAFRETSEPISLLMPVCNEAEGIESVVAELAEVVFRYFPPGSEFIIEEGGSTDGTKEILRRLQERWPFLQVTYKDEKEGFAKAAISLYRQASCPLVFFTDSDGQCVATEFWKLADAVEDHDFVLGVKGPRYDPVLRKLSSRAFNFLARRMFGFRFHDINYGFRLCRREAVLETLKHARWMPTLINSEITILAHLMGYRITEVQVYHRPRLSGMSRGLVPGSVLSESWKAFRALLRLKTETEAIRRLRRDAGELDHAKAASPSTPRAPRASPPGQQRSITRPSEREAVR